LLEKSKSEVGIKRYYALKNPILPKYSCIDEFFGNASLTFMAYFGQIAFLWKMTAKESST
jgi:hypothetical protein